MPSKLALLRGDPDLMAGDPGFFSFIGRAIKGIAGFGGARKKAAQLGRGAPTVPGAAGAAGAGGGAVPLEPGTIFDPTGGAIQKAIQILQKHPVLGTLGATVIGGGAAGAVAGAAAKVLGRIRGKPAAAAGRVITMGARRRRAKGITGRELRGFKRVTRLLASVGMVPRHLPRARIQRRRKF